MPLDRPLRILLVEDDEADYLLTRQALARGSKHELEWASTYEAGLEAVRRGGFDAILLDYRLGGYTGLDFLKEAGALGCRAPMILLTGQHNPEVDRAAMRAGAADYLVKDEITPSLLERSLRYAVRQHLAEEALRRSEERSRMLVESVRAIVWRGDPQTFQFSFVSKEAEHLLGYPVEQWTTEPDFWVSHIHPEDRKQATALYREAAERGEPHEFEYQMIAADGRVVWLRDIVRVVGGELVGVTVDVTEQKQIEEGLHLRERALAAISEGILITDPNQPGNPVIYANEGFERITGYSAGEAIGRNCRFLQGAGTDSEAVARLRAAIREGRPVVVELLNYRRDGTPFWNELSIAPVSGDRGKVVYFVGVQKDVTERKGDELEIQHRLEVERTIAEVSRLLTTGAADLDAVLRLLGEAASVNRAYLFMFREDGRTADNTHEWCSPGTKSRKRTSSGSGPAAVPVGQ